MVHGNRWRNCISNPNFKISQYGYIGLSASNLGIAPQNISISKFQFVNRDTDFKNELHPYPRTPFEIAINDSINKKSIFEEKKKDIIALAKKQFLNKK